MVIWLCFYVTNISPHAYDELKILYAELMIIFCVFSQWPITQWKFKRAGVTKFQKRYVQALFLTVITDSPFAPDVFLNNIGTLNVHKLFWMLQCNLTESDESTFFVLNVDWIFVRNWVLPYINGNVQMRRSSCYIFTFLYLSLLHLVQVKQIVKVKYISTHQTLIRRKTLRFPRSFLSQNVTHRK